MAKLDRKIEEHRLKELNSSRTTPRTSVVLSQRTTSLGSKLQSHQLRYPGARKYSRSSSGYVDGLSPSTVRGPLAVVDHEKCILLTFRSEVKRTNREQVFRIYRQEKQVFQFFETAYTDYVLEGSLKDRNSYLFSVML